jgi:DNA topoisomerase-1
MAKPLVIVESPTKAKTLGRFLGTKYRVEASYGHIRDLPESAASVPKEIKDKEWGRLGVDVESDFKPYYVVPIEKKKQVAHLKSAIKDASELLLATDPDREGESISWHLREVLQPKIPVRRLAFHEITEDAVNEALENPSEINETWSARRRAAASSIGSTATRSRRSSGRRCRPGLSAGRVQSVAVRLIVEREEERRAFRSAAVLGPRGETARRGARVRGHARRGSTTSGSQRQGLRRHDRRPQESERTAARRGRGRRAGRGGRQKRAVAGHLGRGQARSRAPVAAVHHVHAHAGGQPQARFSTERTMQIAQRLFQGIDLGTARWASSPITVPIRPRSPTRRSTSRRA